MISLLSSNIIYAENCKASEDSSRLTVAGGSLTEIVYLLGQEKKLIAVDITSNYPDKAKELPSIGYVRALSAEGVLSLSPTLILGEKVRFLKQILIMGRSTLPYLCHWTGLRLVLGVPALVHDFDTLTKYF